MRKCVTLVLGLVMALGAASPAHAAVQRHRYVAQPDSFALRAFVSGWTDTPLRGGVRFVPAGTTLEVKLADRVAPFGVPLVLSTVDGGDRRCVHNGAATTFEGLRPGQPVWLYVLAEGCGSGGTTGFLTQIT